ncbi:MAG: ATP-binding cassette domain-containing protein [Chloroflexi bacterium]|nr:ATP-binding cassette domain-containing protein [Chloroflexota bacterium]
MSSDALVDVEHVSYAYGKGGQYALRDVSMQIHKGEFVAFVGQNGAGKTTLAKHFNGLLLPTSGSVHVGGVDTREHGIRRLAGIVGYCYQNPDHQIFSSKVRSEVAFGPKNLGLTPDEVKRRVDEALTLVGLQDRADDYPFLLGRGERQLLAVASILATGSQILVVDEPTTGLDPRGTQSIMGMLQRWNRESDRAIVVITHDMRIVAEYVPRTVMMAGGKIVADGPTREVLRNEAALELAGVRPPQVTRIAAQLERYGVAPDVMTTAELVAEVHRLLERLDMQDELVS